MKICILNVTAGKFLNYMLSKNMPLLGKSEFLGSYIFTILAALERYIKYVAFSSGILHESNTSAIFMIAECNIPNITLKKANINVIIHEEFNYSEI